MSKLAQEIDAFLKSAGSLADDFNKQNLGVKADKLDKLVNGQITPRLGLHVTLIGACFMVSGLDRLGTISFLYAFVAVALAAFYFVSAKLQQEGQAGLPGASAVFITAAVSTAQQGASVSILPAAIAIAIPYAIISLSVACNRMERQELVFAPVYSALILLFSTTLRDYALLLFLPVAIAGFLALLMIGKMSSSYGLLTSALAVGAMQVARPTLDNVTMGMISTANIVALQLFIVRAVGPSNSDLRNFLNQGLPALAILGMILLFGPTPYPYWFWPVGLAAFFTCAYVIGGRGGLPTAFGWICIAAIGAILLSRKSFNPESWEYRAGLTAILCLAQLLYFAARYIENRFTCDLARVLLLVGAALCVKVAFDINALWRIELSYGGQEPFLSWKNHAVAVTLFLVFLAALCAALSYDDPTQRASISWWRGLIRPRHAVLLRTAIRGSAKAIESIPFLGGAWKALLAGGRSLRYLKSGGDRPRLGDVSVLISGALLALAVAALVDAALWTGPDSNLGGYGPARTMRFSASIPHAAWQSHTLAWTICSILLYGYGLARRQALFVFAATAFALVPVILHVKSAQMEARGIMLLTAGLAIIFCALLRWERPLIRIGASLISIALATSVVATFWAPPVARNAATVMTCLTRAAEYRLPKTLIRLQIKATDKNARVAAKDVTISQMYAQDSSKTFCLDHLLAGDFQDDITIERDTEGLLAAISGNKNNGLRDRIRTPQTAIAHVGNGLSPVALPSREPTGFAAKIEFDPSDPVELRKANVALEDFGLCVFVEGLPVDGIECNLNQREPIPTSKPERRVEKRRGSEIVFYRPNLSYKLVVSRRADKRGNAGWVPISTRAVQIPNASPILALKLTEADLVGDGIRLSFVHGTLTGITAGKKRKGSEPRELSLSAVHTERSVPPQVLRIGLNGADNRKQLQAAQRLLLNALAADPGRAQASE